MTNHYWDRVTAPHADRDRTAPPTDRDADNVPSDRTTVAEAIAAWEAKGPTSLTVALLAEATYAARDTTTRVEVILDAVEANPVGWGGPAVVSLARTIRAALRGPMSTEEPSDRELPGMWEAADFLGGAPDVVRGGGIDE